jgi:hypothetical protein
VETAEISTIGYRIAGSVAKATLPVNNTAVPPIRTGAECLGCL